MRWSMLLMIFGQQFCFFLNIIQTAPVMVSYEDMLES